jgi:hypothetical protein
MRILASAIHVAALRPIRATKSPAPWTRFQGAGLFVFHGRLFTP